MAIFPQPRQMLCELIDVVPQTTYSQLKRVPSVYSGQLGSFLVGCVGKVVFSGQGGQWLACQILTIRCVPNSAQLSQTKRQDYVTSLDSPRHTRLFESLCEHGFAGCLRYATTDGKAHSAIVAVVHVVLV